MRSLAAEGSNIIYYFSSFQHQVKQEVQGLTYLYLRCGTLTLPHQRRIPTQALSMCIYYIFVMWKINGTPCALSLVKSNFIPNGHSKFILHIDQVPGCVANP